MNLKHRRRIIAPTAHVVGLSVLFLVPGLLISLIIEWVSPTSHDEIPLAIGAVVAAVIGLVFWLPTTTGEQIHHSSVFSAVTYSWIAVALVGAIPYLSPNVFGSSGYGRAFFESVSGFSATGSTVLTDIEALGRGMSMWRQITQFYGGMGMVVLAVTVLPVLGVGGLSLISAEAPGLSTDRLAPRVTETARTLWKLYVGGTLVIALALWIAPGPDLYDSIAHAMTTTSTGGFSPYNSSVGHFDSVLVEMIISGGLFFGSVNFTLHHRALKGDLGAFWRSNDFRVYCAILTTAVVVITAVNTATTITAADGTVIDATFSEALPNAIFNVLTLSSSGGFGNAQGEASLGNFVLWHPGLQFLLIILMFIGGNVGSTAGGSKVFRVHVAVKHALRSFKRLRHRSGVFPVRLGSNSIPVDIVQRCIGFLATFVLILTAGTLIVTATGAGLVESFTACLTALSGVGPGLGQVGPTANFLYFTEPARIVIACLMIVGRLELFAVLLMFAAPMRALRNRT